MVSQSKSSDCVVLLMEDLRPLEVELSPDL